MHRLEFTQQYVVMFTVYPSQHVDQAGLYIYPDAGLIQNYDFSGSPFLVSGCIESSSATENEKLPVKPHGLLF